MTQATTSLRRRGAPLADPTVQRALLDGLALANGDFDAAVAAAGHGPLRPALLEVFQINVGKVCNMTCRHCHVDAGPDRSETMSRATAEACLAALDRTTAHTVDLTGGAPEMSPYFRELVAGARTRGKHVMDRCNLTILLQPGYDDLPAFLAEHQVEVVCSLPHHRKRNTDAQRGDGTYERSIAALRALNAVGYGQGDPGRRLTLVSNPAGAYLPGSQAALEREWKGDLAAAHGVFFDRLITLANMPIARFLEWLETSGNLAAYMNTLVEGFNPATVAGLMCRNTLSVGWDGKLYDCDFNQMLDLPLRDATGSPMTVFDFDPAALAGRRVATGRHCFGCTAGAGSSCGGSIA